MACPWRESSLEMRKRKRKKGSFIERKGDPGKTHMYNALLCTETWYLERRRIRMVGVGRMAM
jgi:hypothetical protein